VDILQLQLKKFSDHIVMCQDLICSIVNLVYTVHTMYRLRSTGTVEPHVDAHSFAVGNDFITTVETCYFTAFVIIGIRSIE